MATYQSTQISGGAPTRAGIGECITYGSVALTAAAADADILQFCKVGKGFTLGLAVLSSSDIDTNGSPTITIDVGDASDTNRIFAASDVGQAGTLSSAMATAGHLYEYTADTTIYGTIANTATGATGTVKLTLIGTHSHQ